MQVLFHLFGGRIISLRRKKCSFFIDDKESSIISFRLEENDDEENVLYFPETHLEPYQVEKTQNANIVLRTEVLNRLNFDKRKIIVKLLFAFRKKV